MIFLSVSAIDPCRETIPIDSLDSEEIPLVV